jgi:ATP-dependent DNA ligase
MLKAKQVDYIDAVIIGFKDPEINYTGKEIETWQYWIDNYYMKPLPVGLHYKEKNAAPVTKHYYFGWKNAIEIGAYDEQGKIHSIGTIASGLTDSIRAGLAENPEKYLHKVVELQCMMKDNKEQTLRHGFFLRFRDDKNPEDCKLKDIFK